MAVHLRSLVADMGRYLDIATFDVVVNLEGEKPTFHGRIRVPSERRPDIERFLGSFRVPGVTWEPYGNWHQAVFPVIPYDQRGF
ncbi:hypothetical protein [Methylorubrum extorquens]|uniref:hypothetical protein n=1 Tax=Methylorubrum extorquens TaxID=408 RepID=UPI00209D80D7|nr:hypothetical protein [Methylorubrum extorquens]MCP1540108.1 hypothetical protein [Methylorubrum extorquens]